MDSIGCLTCGFENPQGMAFCGSCGTRLRAACPSCGFENPPAFRFCGRCGADIGDAEAVSEPTAGTTTTTDFGSLSPERRQISVLFCDLVGSTQLSERLDPEDLRDMVLAYQAVCARTIERYDGHVAQYLGDGLLVYFGYPRAHEDDARRAVHAALEILEQIEALSRRFEAGMGYTVEVRIGIHTGDVVVGEVGGGGTREHLAVGSTPNLAARIQGLAEPGTVLISADTEALARGFFAVDSLGPRELKGASRPLEIFSVRQESGVQSLFELSLYEGLTELVGREAELGLFQSSLERVREGEGRVVLLTGEPGIGKSRLVHQLRQQVPADEGYRWRICRGSPFHQTSAFHPVIELLGTALGFDASDSADQKLDKLERQIESWELSVAEVGPLMADLLSVPFGDRYPALQLSPQRRKEAVQQFFVDLAVRLSRRTPLILVFEDLHWFDPSSLELVGQLVESASKARALLLLTARPEFTPPWPLGSDQTRIVVDRLTAEGVRAMVLALTDGKRLPTAVVDGIVEKTDGVPLFVEELTKMLLESELLVEEEGRYVLADGRGTETTLDLSEPLAIPSSLKDSLMARLDRVGEAKRTAQLASVLGREFSFELLESIVPEETDLESDLAALVSREFLFQRGLPPDAEFIFKHALVQDAAYGSLLKSDRRETHLKVAETLETKFPSLAETSPHMLALHLEHGGDLAAAVPQWKNAGDLSAQAWAHAEATSNYERALGLLDRLAAGPERAQQELDLRMSLGIGQIVTRGYAADEVRATYLRAHELSEEIGDTPLPVRYGIWAVHLMRGDLETTRRFARWFKEYAEGDGDDISRMMANACVATWFFYRGQHAQALRYLERAVALWKPEEHAKAAQEYGGCGGFYGHLFTSATLWFLGRPDQAARQFAEVEGIVAELEAPYTATMSLFTGQMLHHLRRDAEGVRANTERLVEAAGQLEFPLLVAMGECGLGWAEARLGDVEGGVARSERGLAFLKATGTAAMYPYCASFLVESLAEAGRHEEGLALVAEAIEICRSSLDTFYLPELLRLEGELLSRVSGRSADARARLDEALEMARQRGSLSFELRTALTLARMQPQEAGARLVAEIRDRFEEGFETVDLQESAALLAERSGVEG